jgi:hypothetical protein
VLFCVYQNIIPPAPIDEDEEKQVLKRLNDIISMRLFHSKLPPHFSVRVGTLKPSPLHPSCWPISTFSL